MFGMNRENLNKVFEWIKTWEFVLTLRNTHQLTKSDRLTFLQTKLFLSVCDTQSLCLWSVVSARPVGLRCPCPDPDYQPGLLGESHHIRSEIRSALWSDRIISVPVGSDAFTFRGNQSFTVNWEEPSSVWTSSLASHELLLLQLLQHSEETSLEK